jgi:hypothetical protein
MLGHLVSNSVPQIEPLRPSRGWFSRLIAFLFGRR